MIAVHPGLVTDELVLACSFEACPERGHLGQEEFVRIVSALGAGHIQMATDEWSAVQAAKKQSRRSKGSQKRRASRVGTDVNPSDSSLSGHNSEAFLAWPCTRTCTSC